MEADPVRLEEYDDAGLREWARRHGAECAALLGASVAGGAIYDPRAARRLMAGSADPAAASFATALAGLQPGRNRADVGPVAALWEAVPAAERAAWAVRYPGVIGSLTGADFASRVRANVLVAAGLLYVLEAELAAAESVAGPLPALPVGLGVRAVVRGAWDGWRWARKAGVRAVQVSRQIAGFREAVRRADVPIRLLYCSTARDGRFVALSGAVGPATRTVAVVVPGTLTYGNHMVMNLGRLDDVDGRSLEPSSAVGVYWQGCEFPRFITDNADRRFNQAAREKLAAFDAALDVECERAVEAARAAGEAGVAPVQTYIGHSYGASAIGSAEARAEGLTLDRMVYAGAPGTGFKVQVPADTVNAGAERYALVAPVDWKPWLGGTLYGGAMGGDPVREMGAELLETGFLDHERRQRRLLNHNDYLRGGSTAALNIRAVVLGHKPLPAVLRRPWPRGRMSDRKLRRRIDGLRLPR